MSQESKFLRLREEYSGIPLTEDSISVDPFQQFGRWFDEILELDIPMSNAMTLATVDRSGQPSARVVLLKACDGRGFVFYTNYTSRKGLELQDNPRAALLFWWPPVHRQVRIEGTVERVSLAESDEYFASRPRDSNLSAMASPQSQVVPDRRWLEERVSALRQSFAEQELARPADWGGFRLVPVRFEFWQGRPDRLHDRLCYSLEPAGGWRVARLAP